MSAGFLATTVLLLGFKGGSCSSERQLLPEANAQVDSAVAGGARDAPARAHAPEADAGAASADAPPMELPNVGIGATPTCDAAECATAAEQEVAILSAPTAWARTFVAGHCENVSIVGVASGMACDCDTGTGGSMVIGPLGAGCYAFGRAGTCLWGDADYEPCRPEADQCAALCDELQARYAADAKVTVDASVRHSACVDGLCHSVLRIDGRCYADRSYKQGRAFDCALSDAQILEQQQQVVAPEPVEDCGDPEAKEAEVCTQRPPSEGECAPRAAEEWQGLRVCPPYQYCEQSEHCGLARACIEQQCVACTRDDQCDAGEGCVYDHCVKATNIECRKRADCKSGQTCVLSGITGGTPRGNEDMRAYCL